MADLRAQYNVGAGTSVLEDTIQRNTVQNPPSCLMSSLMAKGFSNRTTVRVTDKSCYSGLRSMRVKSR